MATATAIDLEMGDGRRRLICEEEEEEHHKQRQQILLAQMEMLAAQHKNMLHPLLTQTPYSELLHACYCGCAADMAHHLCVTFVDAQSALVFFVRRRDGDVVAELMHEMHDTDRFPDMHLLHVLAARAAQLRDTKTLRMILSHKGVELRTPFTAEIDHLRRLWHDEESSLLYQVSPAQLVDLCRAALETENVLHRLGMADGGVGAVFSLKPDPDFIRTQLGLIT